MDTFSEQDQFHEVCIRFLMSHGYARDSLLFGAAFPFGPNQKLFQVDIAVVGNSRQDYLSFIEFKLLNSERVREMVAKRYKDLLESTRLAIPCFLFSRGDDTQSILIYRLTEDFVFHKISAESFPDFNALRRGANAEKVAAAGVRRTRSLNSLTRHCRWLFSYVLVVLTGDILGFVHLRMEHLYFGLLLGALVVVPEISEITVSTISLKRRSDSE